MHGHELRRLGRINEAIARFEAADKLQRDYLAREKIARRVRLAPCAQPRPAGGVVSVHRPDEEGRGAAEAVVQPADEPAGAGGQQARVAGVPARAQSCRRSARRGASDCSSHPKPVVQATGHIEAGLRAAGDESTGRRRARRRTRRSRRCDPRRPDKAWRRSRSKRCRASSCCAPRSATKGGR